MSLLDSNDWELRHSKRHIWAEKQRLLSRPKAERLKGGLGRLTERQISTFHLAVISLAQE